MPTIVDLSTVLTDYYKLALNCLYLYININKTTTKLTYNNINGYIPKNITSLYNSNVVFLFISINIFYIKFIYF